MFWSRNTAAIALTISVYCLSGGMYASELAPDQEIGNPTLPYPSAPGSAAPVNVPVIDALVRRVIALRREGRSEEAILLLRNFTAAGSLTDSRVPFLLGALYFDAQRYEEAEQQLTVSVRLKDDGRAWHLLSRTQARLGKQEPARAAARSAVMAVPGYVPAWLHYAQLMHALDGHVSRTHPNSLRVLNEGLSANPGDPLLLMMVAATHYEDGNFADAAEAAQASWTAEKENGAALQLLIRSRQQQEEQGCDALSAELETLGSLYPEDTETQVIFAHCANLAGDHDRALEILGAAPEQADGHLLFQKAVALHGLEKHAELRKVALAALVSGIDLHEAEVLQGFLSALDSEPASARATVARLSGDDEDTVLGSISFRDSDAGMVIEPQLGGLDPGFHAAHIHEFSSCDFANDMAGGAAGGHAFHHGGGGVAYGDLPDLRFDEDRRATGAILAPFLRVSMLDGKSIVLHAKPTGFDDNMRIACGAM